MGSVVESSNPVVRALIEGTAPRPAVVAASRGVLPLPESDLLEVLVAFARSDDSELTENARSTIFTHDSIAIESSLRGEGVAASVLDFFAEQSAFPSSVHEAIVANPKTPPATLVRFARTTSNSDLIDRIAQNQQLLIRSPDLIEAILENPNSRSESSRRASETKREFFEKERGAQQIANELRAQGKEAAAEFIETSEFGVDLDAAGMGLDDAMFLAGMIEVPDSETDDSWLGLEFIEEIYEETSAQRQAIVDKIIGDIRLDESDIGNERISVINRVMKMGMKDRVKLAMKGDREARNILIRDPNRIVSQAVVQNPRITEQEMEKIAAMRSISEDVLRQIANDRQWSRSYAIVHNLARNPRTPIANVLTILSRLYLRDLAALSKNKNVSDAVRRQSLRLSQARTGK
ncbi:MAG TPA: hypothetical protein PKD26_07760 [Pyrinomonadaceae bacterium]|nr:hypothetical protein [Pyrinomonadaceae bacterium]